MLCAVTPNTRDSTAGVRPACTSSTIWSQNSAGYGGLVLSILDSFFREDEVSAKQGQLQICSEENKEGEAYAPAT